MKESRWTPINGSHKWTLRYLWLTVNNVTACPGSYFGYPLRAHGMRERAGGSEEGVEQTKAIRERAQNKQGLFIASGGKTNCWSGALLFSVLQCNRGEPVRFPASAGCRAVKRLRDKLSFSVVLSSRERIKKKKTIKLKQNKTKKTESNEGTRTNLSCETFPNVEWTKM